MSGFLGGILIPPLLVELSILGKSFVFLTSVLLKVKQASACLLFLQSACSVAFTGQCGCWGKKHSKAGGSQHKVVELLPLVKLNEKRRRRGWHRLRTCKIR